jgi:hypothetical protein
MMTLAGGKAAGIAKWAWSDPEARVHQAIEQVNELAAQTTDPAEQAEIGDTATMLSRLAGTLNRQPVTIGAQLAGDGTIGAQLLDLARTPAWVHEKRGPHGEWERSGLASVGSRVVQSRTRTDQVRKMADARQQRLIAAEVKRQMAQAQIAKPSSMTDGAAPSGGNMAAQIAAQARAAVPEISQEEVTRQLKAMPLLPGEDMKTHLNPLPGESPRENLIHEQLLHQRVIPTLESKAAQVMDQAKAHVATKLAEAKKLADEEEETKSKHDALLKLATESGVAIGGGILAYIETRIGVPDLLAIASSAGAMLVQILIEWRKRL